MTKRIVLCADDYGQALAISQGILALVQQSRLSAVSCLANAPEWPLHAEWLQPFKEQLDIGLHLNLTEGKALSEVWISAYGEPLPSLRRLLCKAFLHTLDGSVVEAEGEAQIDRFTKAMGFLPQFIDGHQHVHHFPVIRQALIRLYEKRLRGQKAYVRCVKEAFSFSDRGHIKKWIIRATGAAVLKRLLEQHHIPHNTSFAGIYDFSRQDNYPLLFPQFLRHVGEGGLIMCHPAWATADCSDVIAEARYQEYQYFMGQQWLDDCQAEGIVLQRFYRG